MSRGELGSGGASRRASRRCADERDAEQRDERRSITSCAAARRGLRFGRGGARRSRRGELASASACGCGCAERERRSPRGAEDRAAGAARSRAGPRCPSSGGGEQRGDPDRVGRRRACWRARAITPSGNSETLVALMARKSTIESLAHAGVRFSVCSSVIAFRPNGVAALPRPSTFDARFMIIAPIAG